MTDQVFLEFPSVTVDEAKRIQKAVVSKPLVSFSLCTALPLELCQNLIHMTGMNQVCFVEEGLVQYYPGMKMDHDIFPLIYPQHLHLYDEFIMWLRTFEWERKKEFTSSFVKDCASPEQESEKIYSLLPPLLRDAVDKDILKLQMREGMIRLFPNMTRTDAVRYMYKHFSRTKKGTLGIGCTPEDILMLEECETCACTKDASIVDYVKKRKGYVAKTSGADGIIEIIQHLE